MTAIGFLIAFFSWAGLIFVARNYPGERAVWAKLIFLCTYILGVIITVIGIAKWMWEALP
jgi:hypothetical protein